jgi:hypothetical protein
LPTDGAIKIGSPSAGASLLHRLAEQRFARYGTAKMFDVAMLFPA